MFKKAERLSRSEFERYFKSGKRYTTPNLTLIHTPHPQLHVGVVVSKKVDKKAHERNQLRRRVYGKLYRALKPTKTGVFIMLLKPPFKSLAKNEQTQEVQKILNRITMSTT